MSSDQPVLPHPKPGPTATSPSDGAETLGDAVMLDRADLERFVVRKDRDALGAIAARHERHLLGVAQGFLDGHHALAREAVQNAWVKVIRHARSFDHRASVRTWLYRIVLNECRSLRKVERSRDERHRAASAAASEPTAGPPLQDERVAMAVAELSDAMRETILLCYHRQLSHAQVAEILMVPLGTVKSRLNAGLASLRRTLSQSQRA
jgi:RNA polymerase sigma-70 factor (ECF subfamily)